MVIQSASPVAVGIWAVEGDPGIGLQGLAGPSAGLNKSKQTRESRRERRASGGEKDSQLVQTMTQSADIQKEQRDETIH
jgi:hypothetical protein